MSKVQPSRAGHVVTAGVPTEDVWEFENGFHHDLCNHCTDIKQCFFAYCCFPCYLCILFQRVGEPFCTPCCVPTALMSLRTKLRTAFRIKGNIWLDFCCTSFCPMCTSLQLEQELDFQGL